MNQTEIDAMASSVNALDADLQAVYESFEQLDREHPNMTALLRQRYGIPQKLATLATHLSDLAALLQKATTIPGRG